MAPTTPYGLGGVNMQCMTHACITAALLRAYRLQMVKGKAFVVDRTETLQEVAVHYWIYFDPIDSNDGFADFSLHDAVGAPAVFGRRCLPEDWSLEIARSQDELETLLRAGRRQCIYLPVSSDAIPDQRIGWWMDQPFDAAHAVGVSLRLGKIFRHCNDLLIGKTTSLTDKTQREAWTILAQGQ